MSTFYATNDYRSYLAHHGIRGMKWGVRRFQNADGSYTSAGKSRYGVGDGNSYNGVKSVKGGLHRLAAKNYDLNARTYEKLGNNTMAGMNRAAPKDSRRKVDAADKAKAEKLASKRELTPEERAARNAKIKKVALAVAGTAAVAAGAYAVNKYGKRTMAEAERIMTNEKKFQMNKWVDKIVQADDQVTTAQRWWDNAVDQGDAKTERGQARLRYLNERLNDRRILMNARTATGIAMDKNITNKKVRRAAQKQVIKRDIANAKLDA